MEAIKKTKNAPAGNGRGKYNKNYGPKLYIEDVRAMLPKVGDRRKERMFVGSETLSQPCTVIYVNEEHLWYRVKFDKSGICQSYKLPKLIGNSMVS